MAKLSGRDKSGKGKKSGLDFPEPLNALLKSAMKEGATDIHLDSLYGGVLVRFRVDGKIHEKTLMPLELGQRLLNQVKVASKVEIDRAFSPLESQIELRGQGEKNDIRVTLIPTGEDLAVHMRFLTAPTSVQGIGNLGFSESDQQKVKKALQAAHGLVLVSGRTGAGKTTTLYSLVSLLDLRSTVAVSIEDQVEFNLPGLRQLEVDESHGLSMSQALRTFLRMDPDVILVGEVRDRDSAVAAAQAALAGRLVIATIHASDSAGAVEALHHLSVPYYVLGGLVSLIISQGLVRRLCQICKKPRELTAAEQGFFSQNQLDVPERVWDPVGCEACNLYGYQGMLGIFETALVNESMSNAISSGMNMIDLRQEFKREGTCSAAVDGLRKVSEGNTSLEEIIRISWPFVDDGSASSGGPDQ